jgi:four helix bundle protein
VVTSGSFEGEGSRWPADVKGKPVEPVRSTLDIGSLTGSWEGMNDPEVTMSNTLNNTTNLIAHEKALQAAGDAITLVMRVPTPLKSIADQVIRSASSVAANLAEGHGRTGRDRLHFWRIAYASAKEVDSHMKLLARAGAINRDKTEETLSTFDEVRAMTSRLIHRTS